MGTYSKIKISFFIALNCLVILHSCEPPDETQNCGDSPPIYYSLSAAQKAIIPYTGYDTITMVSNTGDTIRCVGTGKQYFNTREFVPHSHPSCAGYGTEKFYEAYKIEFVDSSKNKKIELSHYHNSPNGLFKGLSAIYITALNNSWGTRDDHISKASAYNFFGNVELRSIQYFDVTKAQGEPNDTNSFVLINKLKGILKIQINQNETWELLPN